ncbi:putative tRNA (guanine(26)-N(2))-dimethyltransferase [Armadillidium vulgare]|nr:putative tRNA (guanine(26)-N(2))-dimethyltransferase [Armadillidium vulgare]
MEEEDDSLGFAVDANADTCVTEGLARVNFPSSRDVFFNPVQEFNRDMSIAVLRLHASDYKKVIDFKVNKNLEKKCSRSLAALKTKEEDFKREFIVNNTEISPCGVKDENGIRVLEALAASGLRSIRYAKEVGGIKEIIANDISKQAIECLKSNLESNDVHHIVEPSLNDASLVMYQNRNVDERFTAVDLDPYGSPHIFLDGAVQSVTEGGLLMVTSTDMAVLCGNAPETCYLKYGALSPKLKSCHEIVKYFYYFYYYYYHHHHHHHHFYYYYYFLKYFLLSVFLYGKTANKSSTKFLNILQALRIILQAIEANANKYGRYIVPLLSLSVDFYARVFVRVFTSPVKCKDTCAKLSYLHYCTSCESTSFQSLGYVVRNGNSVKYHPGSPNVGANCSHCGGTIRTAGPIWTDPIHDLSFVSRLKSTLDKGTPLKTFRRMEGMLTMIGEELPDTPLYIVFDKILKVIRMSPFKRKEFMSAILNAGYRVSPTHASHQGVKTDAPYSFIWNVLRERQKLVPVNVNKLDKAGKTILRLDGTNHNEVGNGDVQEMKINFTLHPGASFESENHLRFQVNPHENWGPKARAVTSLFHGDLEEKSKKKQGTRKKRKRENNSEDLESSVSQDDMKENI